MVTQTRDTAWNVWWLLLLQGIAAIILGLLLLTHPARTAEAIVIFVGVYWLVSGIFPSSEFSARRAGRIGSGRSSFAVFRVMGQARLSSAC